MEITVGLKNLKIYLEGCSFLTKEEIKVSLIKEKGILQDKNRSLNDLKKIREYRKYLFSVLNTLNLL